MFPNTPPGFKRVYRVRKPLCRSKAQVKADVSENNSEDAWQSDMLADWTSVPPASPKYGLATPTTSVSSMDLTFGLTGDLKKGISLIQSLKNLTLDMKSESKMIACDELIRDLECVFFRVNHEVTRKESQDPVDVLLDSTVHKVISEIIEVSQLRSDVYGSSDFVDVALSDAAAVEKLEKDVKEIIKAQTTTYFDNLEGNIKMLAVNAIISKAQQKVKEDLLLQFNLAKDKQTCIHHNASAWTFDGTVNYEDGTSFASFEVDGRVSDNSNDTKVLTPGEPRADEPVLWGEPDDWDCSPSPDPSSAW